MMSVIKYLLIESLTTVIGHQRYGLILAYWLNKRLPKSKKIDPFSDTGEKIINKLDALDQAARSAIYNDTPDELNKIYIGLATGEYINKIKKPNFLEKIYGRIFMLTGNKTLALALEIFGGLGLTLIIIIAVSLRSDIPVLDKFLSLFLF